MFDLDEIFKYHAPTPDQVQQYGRLREAAKAFAQVVVDELPPCADRTAAVRKIREAVYDRQRRHRPGRTALAVSPHWKEAVAILAVGIVSLWFLLLLGRAWQILTASDAAKLAAGIDDENDEDRRMPCNLRLVADPRRRHGHSRRELPLARPLHQREAAGSSWRGAHRLSVRRSRTVY